ncbi:MAG: PaaI family thioesterase [Pseudomonadota bacterium]
MTEEDDKPSLAEMLAWRGSSGIVDFIGHRISELGKEHAVVELDIGTQFMNRGGSVHGGIYCLLMDTAGGYAGVYSEDPNNLHSFITVSLSTNFVGSPDGARLFATGRLRGGGRSTFFSDIDVKDETGKLLATGSGAFRRIAVKRAD